jgi:hypothetical protein
MNKILEELKQFTGTEQNYRHKVLHHSILLTDGANFIRERCQSYWLFDIIAIYQQKKDIQTEPFQTWELKQNKPLNCWKLICEDGNHKQLLVEQIPFSDFPLEKIKLWLVNGTVMLPSEY